MVSKWVKEAVKRGEKRIVEDGLETLTTKYIEKMKSDAEYLRNHGYSVCQPSPASGYVANLFTAGEIEGFKRRMASDLEEDVQ